MAGSELEAILGHVFQDQKMLKLALTHSSLHGNNYERLEFLGDRVLGLAVAQAIYKKFPNEAEGDLAKRLAALVQGITLAEIAREINLGRFIEFSAAERDAGGSDNENILADVMESLIGAIYLESDFTTCYALIERLWGSRLEELKKPPAHPKTALQEWAQGKGLPLPAYDIAGQSGPDHAPIFEIALKVEGFDILIAHGRSRQEAEKQVAGDFIKLNKERFDA